MTDNIFNDEAFRLLCDWAGFTSEHVALAKAKPYKFYQHFTRVKEELENKHVNLRHVADIDASLPKDIVLADVVSDLEKSGFDYVDPKILKWFGADHAQKAFSVSAGHYQSIDNLSHREARTLAAGIAPYGNFEFSLIEALFLNKNAIAASILVWPRKYLITYITERYEDKICRVLSYRYDDGQIEIYVNQMDPGDVWTPGVGYLFRK